MCLLKFPSCIVTQLFDKPQCLRFTVFIISVSWQMQSLFLPVVFISSPVLSDPQYYGIFPLSPWEGCKLHLLCIPCCQWSGGEIGFHVGSLVLAVVCCSFSWSGPLHPACCNWIFNSVFSQMDDRAKEKDILAYLLTIYILLFPVSPTGTSSSPQSVCCV